MLVAGFVAKQTQPGVAHSFGAGVGCSGQLEGPDGVIGAVIAAQRLIGLKSKDTTSRMTNPLVVAILLMAVTQN